MKVKIAMFASSFGSQTAIAAWESGEFWADTSKGYTRLTEAVEVDFPDLPATDIQAKQLERLAEQETDLRAKFSAALAQIEDQRKKLLAIAA